MSDETKDYEEPVEDDVNVVGIHKSKKLFVVLVVCAATGLLYYAFFRGGDQKPEQFEEPGTVVEQNHVEKLLKEAELPAQETAPRILTPPPRLPELPPLVMPSVPDIPVVTKQVRPRQDSPPVEEVKEIPAPYELSKPKVDEGQDLSIPAPYGMMSPERVPSFLGYDKERRGTPMIALGGGGSEGGSDDETQTHQTLSVGNMERTPSPNVKATRVGDPRYMILQGHVIDAVLETAINSDIPGVLRAIVSRDVYASAGNRVMVPKGSRLIGSYFFDSGGNGFRVTVNWFRVILPNGIDVQINSGGTDELGRNGIAGVVDTKVGATLTSTVLLAGVSLGTAFVASKIPSLQSEIVNTETTSTKGKEEPSAKEEKEEKKTSSNLPTKIVSDAIKDFSETVKGIIKKYSDTQPTVYVDQGTVMKVFVNQDVVFPKEAVLQ